MDRTPTVGPIYHSGDWEVDLARRELRRRGEPVLIGSHAFDVLGTLVQSAGDVVTKDELMARVWAGISVEENTLHVHVSTLRRALDTDRDILKTVPGRGYRLLGSWTAANSIAPKAPSTLGPTSGEQIRGNLPLAAMDLIGRQNAVQQLKDLLSAYRVVTLTGSGGIGKSKLALEAARNLQSDVAGEGWLVELASLSEPNLVPFAVARTLGLKVGAKNSSEAVALAIGARKLLLVLDNCEHVIDSSAELAETIVRKCPQTTVLATSRELLRIGGEYVYRVPPLDVPPEHCDDHYDILSHSAAQLFIARTTALNATFLPRRDELSAVAAICRQLDGIPLAIEFAAARAAALGVAQVAEHLDDRFGLLTGGRRTALPRHQTLRATLDWSYDLLAKDEQQGLRCLSILVGRFTLEAAEKVLILEQMTALKASNIIDGLVAKSLVVAETAGGEANFRLLETTCAYGLARLKESGEYDGVARRHARYFQDLFGRANLDWQGNVIGPALPMRDSPIDNLRTALNWAFSPTGDTKLGISLTIASAPHLMHLSMDNECRLRVGSALAVLEADPDHDPSHEMKLLNALGMASAFTTAGVAENRDLFARALAIANRLNDKAHGLRAYWGLCQSYFNDGDHIDGHKATEQFHVLAAASNDPRAMALADLILGGSTMVLGEHAAARKLLEHLMNRLNVSTSTRVLALGCLGCILYFQGHHDQSKRCLQEAVNYAASNHAVVPLCTALGNWVCFIYLVRGDLDEAERMLELLIELASEHDLNYWLAWGNGFKGALLVKRGELESGLNLLRTTFEESPASINHTRFIGLRWQYLEALASTGKANEVLPIINREVETAIRKGHLHILPEYYRIKGELIAQQSDPGAFEDAQGFFSEGLRLARQQGSILLELKLALPVARLSRGKREEDFAFNQLARVYEQFAEGFETTDLKEARSLLESRSQSPL
jgi:predicted ATPase/DNA-binding winged helix-turn-helix (wHTH) protein